MRLASFERHGVRSYGLIDGARIHDVDDLEEIDIDHIGTLRDIVATDTSAT